MGLVSVSMGVESLVPIGIRSPDCPAHSESLNWLHYPVLVITSHNMLFCGAEESLDPHPMPKLKDHALSSIHNSFWYVHRHLQ